MNEVKGLIVREVNVACLQTSAALTATYLGTIIKTKNGSKFFKFFKSIAREKINKTFPF